MSLAHILYPPPTTHGFEEWSFQHLAHHRSIISATQAKKGVLLTLENIYPINQLNIKDFLFVHQDMHNSMNTIWGVPGADLLDVDFQDKRQADGWFYLQYIEHRSVAQNCGLPI